jgi:hypothetical protein
VGGLRIDPLWLSGAVVQQMVLGVWGPGGGFRLLSRQGGVRRERRAGEVRGYRPETWVTERTGDMGDSFVREDPGKGGDIRMP